MNLLVEPLYDYVEIEHQVIRDGFNELFTEISSDKILHWGEETSTEEEEETEQPTEGPSMQDVEEKNVCKYNLQTSKWIPF